MKNSLITVAAVLGSTHAFAPALKTSTHHSSQVAASALSEGANLKPIFDPLGLYPKDAPERMAGLIQPLEQEIKESTSILDPLGLYPNEGQTSEISEAIPFLTRPAHLDGSMAGDRGFDPFNLASNPDTFLKYRNSELKHARLAMLAAVGWPLAELFHNGFAASVGLPSALAAGGRVPSVLNGGLGNVSPVFWVAAIAAAATVEIFSGRVGEIQSADLGWDPLRIFQKEGMNGLSRLLEEGELANGRIAMLAITGFAIQEFVTGTSIVESTPIFFHPWNVAIEQLLHSGAASV